MSRRSDKNVISSDELAKRIIELGHSKEFGQLQELIAKCENKLLERTIVKRIDRSDATILWNYMLIGCESNSESMANTRFSLLVTVLDEMNKVEITSKQTFDLITRTFIELPKLRVAELMQLSQYCMDSLKVGDPKCTGWKELFPELMKLLADMPKIMVNNEVKTGNEYCESQIKSLIASRWPDPVLSSIGAMFLEMPILKNDKILVLNKLCENLLKLEPQELPTLAFQMFTLSTTAAQLMIPLISLNQYFQKYLYQKQLDQTDSEPMNIDSIDRFDDSDLLAAQNTILYHLSSCSEYKISEKEMVNQITNMASSPKYILTPFMLSALLTICNVSRYLESVRLSVSSTLPFIRNVIQNNQKEVELCNNSAWFRDTLEHTTVDINKVYSILVEQSKEDIFTPGLVGMAFVLLKSPQYSSLNVMGILFLEEIVKARHQLGYGVLRNLKEFLFANQDAPQYTECLTRLSLTNPMMISEHLSQIKEIIDFFLLIPGNHAMRMMTFIVPLTKTNGQIREYFIDMLRRAMYQSNISTRQMAVYGFCLILKQLRNNSAWRASARGGSTQLSISGFSMMSQQMLRSGNNPNLAFDICVLEIVGILRKCFNQTYEIKDVLYDGLSNAVQQNPKLISHALQFLEWQFRSCFNETGDSVQINFDKAIVEVGDAGTVQVNDHIGKLLQFITQCIILNEHHGLEFETGDLTEFFDKLLDKITTLDQIGLGDTITPMSTQIGLQFMNCLEGLMYYCLKTHDINETSVAQIVRLFQHHQKCFTELQEAFAAAKKALRKKNDSSNSSGQLKLASQVTALKPENIWDLITVHGFLEAICRRNQESNLLWEENEFCVYVLNVARAKIEGMRSAPEYKQIKYSKSNFKYLCDISALMLKYFVKDLPNMLDDTDIKRAHASVDCFRECLTTATVLYQRKFTDCLKILQVPLENLQMNDINTNLINILQNVVDKTVTEFQNNDVRSEHQVILQKMFQCLEILYDNIALTQDEAISVFNWLHHYSKSHSIEVAEHTIVHKVLFTQSIRTQKGPMFEGMAKQIEELLGQIQEEPIEGAEDFKSISSATVEICINQLCNAVRKQIEDVEYFISKVKSYYAQIKTGGLNEDDRKSCENRMLTTERRICTQLIFISRVCIHLANTLLPLGQCMDNFTRLLTQFYVCLANVTKHFINRQKFLPISYKSTKFDQLVQTIGKKLPLKVYALISYIEDNIFDLDNDSGNEDETKRPNKQNAKNHKAKVMRDTKNIPKLILRIENFNKFVITLSKKTDHDLNKCLHMGTVRDFRIRTDALREAIEKIRENDSDESNNEDETNDSDYDIDDESTTTTVSAQPSTSSTGTPSGSLINEEQPESSLRTTVMKNLNAINKRASKRKKRDTANVEDSNENDENEIDKHAKKRRKKDNSDEATTSETGQRRSNRRKATE